MRLILVDDHRILLEGIRALLDSTHEVVSVFTDPAKAERFLRDQPVDVLITDYQMPGLNGIELFRKCLRYQPLLKGILLSMHDEQAIVKRAIKEGMHGFLLKNTSSTELNIALDKIKMGHTYISAELTQKLVAREEPLPSLSDRERQVLHLIIREYSNKQIADALFLSERTVETYRKNLFRKANTNNVVGLVKYAYANKLMPDDSL